VKRLLRLALVALAAVTAFASPTSAQRTDVLTMVNGDEITGEIKGMTRGRLTYKTDDMGTLSVKWDKVIRLRTTHIQEVLLSNGRRRFGSLRDADQDGRLVILGDTIRLIQIIEITPIEATFLQRTNGFLNFGFTVAQANNARTLTFDWEANYRGEIWGTGANGSSYYQEQEGADPTRRNNVTLSGLRFITGRWAVVTYLDATQNDELGLDLRASISLGAQNRTVLTRRTELKLAAGLVVNQEKFTTAEAATKNLELMGRLDWDLFRYDSPKYDLSVDFQPFLNLTTLGRYRIEFNTRASYEVFSDFNVGVTFRDSFDSQPGSEEASKNDYTVTLTIGWSWS